MAVCHDSLPGDVLAADGFLCGVCDEGGGVFVQWDCVMGSGVSVSGFWFRDICRSRLTMIRAKGELGFGGLPWPCVSVRFWKSLFLLDVLAF